MKRDLLFKRDTTLREKVIAGILFWTVLLTIAGSLYFLNDASGDFGF